jgi:hypothetical protein
MEKELLELDIIAAKFFCVKFRIYGTLLKNLLQKKLLLQDFF